MIIEALHAVYFYCSSWNLIIIKQQDDGKKDNQNKDNILVDATLHCHRSQTKRWILNRTCLFEK